MTTASIEAYHESKPKRISDKTKIFAFLIHHKGFSYTYPQLSKLTGVSINNTHKRLTDMYGEGLVRITGQQGKYSLYTYHIGRTHMTKPKAFEQAINEICPMFLDEVINRVNELI